MDCWENVKEKDLSTMLRERELETCSDEKEEIVNKIPFKI